MSWQLYKKWYLFMFEVQMTLVSRRAEILGNECYNESRSIVNKSQVSFLQLRTVYTRKQVWVFFGFFVSMLVEVFRVNAGGIYRERNWLDVINERANENVPTEKMKTFPIQLLFTWLSTLRYFSSTSFTRHFFFSSHRWSMSMLKSSRWLITNKTIFTIYVLFIGWCSLEKRVSLIATILRLCSRAL